MRYTPVSVVCVVLAACAPVAAPATAPEPSRSPVEPVVADTRTTIGFPAAGVWLSSRLDGGRGSAFRQEDDSAFVVHIRPENAPINNSAWYAFKVWSQESRTIDVRLTYEGGRHRYWPKTRRAGEAWTPLDSAAVQTDTVTGAATIRLAIGPDTVWVAGQPVKTSSYFERWTDSLAARPHIDRIIIGASPQGRPLHLVRFGDAGATRHVMLISRQHPPEVTGTIALVRFVEELAGDSPLAQEFRRHFRVHVVPLLNPDGVDLGHWRHNTGGVDLNRDWVDFAQPETRLVRDAFLRVMKQPGAALWFAADFHSTRRDVFYTLDRRLETQPPGILDRWLEYIATHLPHYTVNDAPSDLATPTSRNWFYRQFGAPALIYEVGDHTDPALIRDVAAVAARSMMQVLLDELRRTSPR